MSLLEEIIHLAGPSPQGWLNLLEEKPKAHLENDGILFFYYTLKKFLNNSVVRGFPLNSRGSAPAQII
jgi:hypothetical protein